MAPAETVSPFRDYAFCQGPLFAEPAAATDKPRCCFADDAAGLDCAAAPPAHAGSGGSSAMDCDAHGDQEDTTATAVVATAAAAAAGLARCTSLDALLAAAARKPAPAAAAALPPPPAPARFVTPPLPPAARAVAGLYGATAVAGGAPDGIADAAGHLIAGWGLADTFFVYDLGEVARLHALWVATMPRVEPFYAVKCNPEPGIVAMLNALGCGFDCASVQELERAAALGVPQDRVIFANPCKRPADFRYAVERGVETTTFDCLEELKKIAAGGF
jgi:ornithine decarboxylase